MRGLRISDIEIGEDGRTLTAGLKAGQEVSDFLDTDRLVARYSHSIADVPRGVLAIPAVANLAPLAWGLGAELHVPEVDRAFGNALPKIRRGFNELYPDWEFSGDIHAEVYGDYASHTGDNSMALFSGGVDSLCTYLTNQDENPLLATIYYTDDELTETDEHRNIRNLVGSVADREDAETVGIESNLRHPFDRKCIRQEFRTLLTDGWWGNIQHGLGLLGAVAPTAHSNDVGTVYIAASRTHETDSGWGSHPEIDGRVRWTGTECVHDGFELTRQEKIDRFAGYSRETGEPLPVRTCWRSDSVLNCGTCEKCCRTILGLELAGLDADEHGFDVPDDFFDTIRSGLQVGEWKFTAGKSAMWAELQDRADLERDYTRDGMNRFIDWFQGVDIDHLYEVSNKPTMQDRVAVMLQKCPRPVYQTAVRLASRF